MKVINIMIEASTFPEYWAVIWRGILALTDQETKLVVEIIKKYLELKGEGLIEPYLSEEVLTTERRTEYGEAMGITSQNLRNLISSLRAKNAIVARNPVTKKLALDYRLVPDKQLQFNFNNR